MGKWDQRKRPVRLEKRFEFESYEGTRDFLDRLGSKCESRGRYPDISFGKKYVNITLRPEVDDENASISNNDLEFADEIDKLI
tara:strand:+ start:742 stop:990 length:249 start_codon:yes stop_codon:yes gene_type:complete